MRMRFKIHSNLPQPSSKDITECPVYQRHHPNGYNPQQKPILHSYSVQSPPWQPDLTPSRIQVSHSNAYVYSVC